MPTVHIDADEMAADLVLAAGEVVSSPNVAIVLLARSGVRHGLQHPILATLPETRGPAAVRVALGEPALPGRDGWVFYAFSLPDAGGAFEPLPLPRLVDKGEVLARRHPACIGQLGRTVTGRTLAIAPVQDSPFLAGPGAEVSMDAQFIVAARRGSPHLAGETVVVRPVARIAADVGPEDPPIEFDGDVVVEGHLEHPASIVATGDVHVLGGVQGARIRAGGRVVVHGGVRQEARIEAATIYAKFVEQSELFASDLVLVCEDLIRATLVSPCARIGGAVVGGDLALVEWLEAGELGSEFAAPTRVAVVPPPRPEDPTRGLARDRRAIAEQLTRLAPLLDENRRLAKDPRNESAREMVAKLVGLIAHLQDRDRELAACIEAAPEAPAGPRPFARVAGQVHPGVTLQVGAQHLRLTSPIPASTFLEGRGAVEIAPFGLSLERTLA